MALVVIRYEPSYTRKIWTNICKISSNPETHHPPPLWPIKSSPGSIYFKADQFPILWRFHVFTLTWSVQLYHSPISLKKLLSLPSFFRKYLMGFDDWLISLSFQPTGSNFSCQGFLLIWFDKCCIYFTILTKIHNSHKHFSKSHKFVRQ